MNSKPEHTPEDCSASARSPALVAHSCKLALDFYRSRAPNILSAIRSFLEALCHRFWRLFRLGPNGAKDLMKLELACAHAGLGFPSTRSMLEPPWWLPLDVLNSQAIEFPGHPLIDPQMLTELCTSEIGHQPRVRDALELLLRREGLSARWNSLPLAQSAAPIAGASRVAVCLHLFYPELWPEISAALHSIPEPWDLYVSIPEFACTPVLSEIAREHPDVRFLPCPNRGRDILPFLRFLEMRVFDRYDAVCKLHSKRSPHMQEGARWRTQLLAALLGDRAHVANLLGMLRNQPNLGLIGPEEAKISIGSPLYLASTWHVVQKLANRAGISEDLLMRPFFSGTMFWFKPAAVSSLLRLGLEENDFPLEMGQTDGTLAHAIERIIWPMVEQRGFRCYESGRAATTANSR